MVCWAVFAVLTCFAADAVTADTPAYKDNCPAISTLEKQLQEIQKTTAKMDIFLKRNLENDANSLKKALADLGDVDNELPKESSEMSLESFVLRYQIASHRELKRLISEVKKSVDDMRDSRGKRCVGAKGPSYDKYPFDCSDILKQGLDKNGVYRIYPFSDTSESVDAFCDMDSNGGGWTVIITRMKQAKQINFTQNWEHYKKGFGSPDSEYWLGNDVLHALTSSKDCTLRIEAKSLEGEEIWGEWRSFRVDSEEAKYMLTVGDYEPTSTAANLLMSHHDGMRFSTSDQDNDQSDTFHCAIEGRGGGWYNQCVAFHPTGVYGARTPYGIGFLDRSEDNPLLHHVKWLQMKLRPIV